MAVIDHERRAGDAPAPTSHGWGGASCFFVRRYPLGAVGALIMIAVRRRPRSSPMRSPPSIRSPPTPRSSLAPPGGEHMLGADFMGRDMFSRIVYGARISLAVGVGATALGCLIGVTIGLMSGYLRRLVRPASCSA